ncbi:MAG: OsmC family protein [Bacteroidetes bacterium]|nr:OsmC family protein [Bacteroidota bacterium]
MTAEIIYQGDLRTTATHLQSGSVIETDAPTDNQGKGERFSPTDLLATALGSCMMTIMGIKARDMQIPLAGMKVSIQKNMLADPRRVGSVDLLFSFPETVVVDEKQKKILENAALACPVAKSIHPDLQVNATFNW